MRLSKPIVFPIHSFLSDVSLHSGLNGSTIIALACLLLVVVIIMMTMIRQSRRDEESLTLYDAPATAGVV